MERAFILNTRTIRSRSDAERESFDAAHVVLLAPPALDVSEMSARLAAMLDAEVRARQTDTGQPGQVWSTRA